MTERKTSGLVLNCPDCGAEINRNTVGRNSRKRCRECAASLAKDQSAAAYYKIPVDEFRKRKECGTLPKAIRSRKSDEVWDQKVCSKCGVLKAACEYQKHKSSAGGLASQCRKCKNKIDRERYRNSPECKHKFRWPTNEKEREEMLARRAIREKERGKKQWEKQRQRIKTDPAYARHIKERTRKWRQKNPEWARRKNDPAFRIRKSVRCRMAAAIRKNLKSGSITQMIGCTSQELRDYIQAQFTRGMTWENYGTKWHVDHIQPCASFDLTDENELRKCCHYTNLRPMWAVENISKADKSGHAHQPLILELIA